MPGMPIVVSITVLSNNWPLHSRFRFSSPGSSELGSDGLGSGLGALLLGRRTGGRSGVPWKLKLSRHSGL